jgi:hypothetical protein
MAHQLKSGVSVQYGPRMILQRPALAALLGAIAAEWAVLENKVIFLYVYLMGGYLPRVEGFEPPVHPLALQVFDTLETTHHRLELLRKLAEWVLKDESLIVELRETVFVSVRSAAKVRNTAVHSLWGIAPEYPDALIYMPVFGHQLAYAESDFQQAIDRIVEAHQLVGRFDVKARKFLDGERGA